MEKMTFSISGSDATRRRSNSGCTLSLAAAFSGAVGPPSGYFNDASVIRPSNIIDVHPTLQLSPTDNLSVLLGSDILWRYTTDDAIYSPGGGIVIPPGGHYETSIDLLGGAKGGNGFPRFEVDYIPGVYRFVWTDISDSFTFSSPTAWTAIPIEYRRSNAFAIVVDQSK